MIPQAGIFSAIPFTQINSKTMIVALLARPAEKSGPCAGCGLLLWGALKTREKTEGTVLRKAHKVILLPYLYIHFPLYYATSHVD